MARRAFIAAAGSAAAWPYAAFAQRSRVPQVGLLYPGPKVAAPPRVAALLSGLQAGGFVEPDQMTLIQQITDGNSALVGPMVAELAKRSVDLIVAISSTGVRAARAATTTIPVVALDLESDPVAEGYIANYARPGGNITGVFLDFPDFSKKWLEALKEAAPQVSTVAVFRDPGTGPVQMQAVEVAARELELKLVALQVGGRAEIAPAFQSAVRQGAGMLLMLSSPLIGGNTKLLAELALTHRLPAMTLFTEFARDGGLMAYGPNLLANYRQTGVMAARVLRGTKPGDVPIETPTKFQFVLNLRAAKQLGLTVPPSVLLRADDVIE